MAVRVQRNTILLKGDFNNRYDEAPAAVVNQPGMLVELSATNQIRPGTVADAPNIERLVVIEDALQGKTIDDTYAVGDVTRYMIMKRGYEFQGLLKAGSAAVVPGDYVQSNGDGRFKKLVTGVALARVMEARDLSVSPTDDFVVFRAL